MKPDVSTAIHSFFEKYPEHHFKKGDILVSNVEDPAGVMQLISGAVSQYDIGKAGQKVVLNVFRPPAFMPMSWAINKTPNTYSFEALEDGSYRLAPAEETVNFLEHNPAVLLDLLGRVYRGTDGVLKRMTLLMSDDARSRLLFEILINCRRLMRTPTDAFTLEVKETDLAAYTGLSRETVSRLLQKLKDDDLVIPERGQIVIPSIKRIEDALDER